MNAPACPGWTTLEELTLAAQRLAPLYHAGSYRRLFGISAATAAEVAETLSWLVGVLVEANPR